MTLTSSTLSSDFLSDLMVNDGFDRDSNRDSIRSETWVNGGDRLSYLLAIEMHVTTLSKIWFLRLVRVPCQETSELRWTSRTTSETCFRMKLPNNVDAILGIWGPGISKWRQSSRKKQDIFGATGGRDSLRQRSWFKISMTSSGGDVNIE